MDKKTINKLKKKKQLKIDNKEIVKKDGIDKKHSRE